MQKILFTDKAHPILEQGLRAAGYDCIDGSHMDREEVKAALPGVFGMIIRSRLKVDADLLSQAEQLQFVARIGIGLEHVDQAFAERQNIQVINSPEGSRVAVGEHAAGMLLGLMNHLYWADQEVRQGKWIREANRGTEIKGKTIGIIGYGNTGQAFAKRMSGFEAKVLAYDKYRKDYGDAFAQQATQEQIWEEADIISFHIFYEEANHFLVNAEYLSRFSKPVYLVNTARGLILNTADLVAAMQQGRVLGAALDVIEYEEMSFSSVKIDDLPEPFQYLRQAKNAVLAPHIAGWSHEAKVKHAEVLLGKILNSFPKKN